MTERLKMRASKYLSAEEKQEVLSSRGDKRTDYLKYYTVMRIKDKGEIKSTTLAEEHSMDKVDSIVVHEWNSEIMNKKLGADRATAIRALPHDTPWAVTWDQCPFTLKEKDPFRIWLVPQHCLRTDNLDRSSHKTEVKGDASPADLNLFDSDVGAACSASSTGVTFPDLKVKEETVEQTPLELRRKRLQEIIKNPKPEMRKLYDYQMHEEDWCKRCISDPFKQPLCADVIPSRPT